MVSKSLCKGKRVTKPNKCIKVKGCKVVKTSKRHYCRKAKNKTLKKTVKKSTKRVESGMTVGTKYFIEDSTRRRKDLKTVYAGTYVGTENIGDDVYLNFKGVKIIVNPFNKKALPRGFSPKGYKFIEQV